MNSCLVAASAATATRKGDPVNLVKKTFKYGQHEVSLETGRIARQATGAVLCSVDSTVVLCTVVGARDVREGQDFFPLTVNYQEKTYATGRIPGGFFRREGRPSEKETLTSRTAPCDRCFPRASATKFR